MHIKRRPQQPVNKLWRKSAKKTNENKKIRDGIISRESRYECVIYCENIPDMDGDLLKENTTKDDLQKV